MAHMADDELEPLITECPGCHTRFRVAEVQLQRAGGKVRCGACLTVFHGIRHLTLESAEAHASDEQAQQTLDDLLEELAHPADPGREAETGAAAAERAATGEPAPAADAEPATLSDVPEPRQAVRRPGPPPPVVSGPEATEPAPPADAEDAYAFQVLGGDLADAADAKPAVQRTPAATAPRPRHGVDADAAAGPPPGAGAAATRPESVAVDDAGERLPRAPIVFGEIQQRRPLVWAGIGLGLLLLVAQVLWYRFDEWAKDPQWRSVYVPLCHVLGCELPQQRDRSLLATRNLAVRGHPRQPDSLLVNAVIVNEAEFAQPFPVLDLRFTSVSGVLVAARRYAPEEYLAGDARGMELIPPRTPVQVELTIEDPGPAAVNYFLRFR